MHLLVGFVSTNNTSHTDIDVLRTKQTQTVTILQSCTVRQGNRVYRDVIVSYYLLIRHNANNIIDKSLKHRGDIVQAIKHHHVIVMPASAEKSSVPFVALSYTYPVMCGG